VNNQAWLAKSALIFLLLLSFRLSAAAAEFSAAGSYVAGKDPSAVAVGDFDGDGKLDAVVANFGSDNVSVLLGNGDGTLRDAHNYRVGSGPQSIAVGDFNSDGKLDLAVATLGSNKLSVLLGNGDGTFRRGVNYHVGMGPQFVAAADFNGDGKLDLAVANSADNQVNLLVGNGDGTFRPAQSYRVGIAPQSIAVEDFNGDGALDLAVTNSGSNDVSVLLGKGDGTFQAVGHCAVGKNPYSIAVGDFDGDGKPDLAVTNHENKNVSVLLGKGDGAFDNVVNYVVGTKAQGLAAGDFNGDRKSGIAVANPDEKSIGMLLGRDGGSLQTGPSFSAGSDPSSVAVGDFNGDGAPDLIVANPKSNTVSVLINSPVIKLSPGSLKFGVRGVGTQSPAMNVTLANSGGAPLKVTSIRLDGKNSRDFAQTSTCPLTPFSLAAYQTCTLNLTFTPSAKGIRKASLSVTDNALGSPHSVALTGGDPTASTTWTGGAGNWSDVSKWTNGVPTNATDALIDSGNPAASSVTLDIGSGQANNLTIDSDDSLSFNNGTELNLNGSNVSNAGTISLNSVGTPTILNFASSATLAGTGTVTVSNNTANQIDGSAVLTNQSTIQGGGMIGPRLTLANQGTINANLTGAALLFSQATGATNTNAATMEATNGATLQLQTSGGGGINNTGGTIKAVGNGSQVQLTGFGTTITGGTLTTSGGGLIVEIAGGISTLSGLTNSGTFSILDGATVNLEGTLTNTGTIQLNAGGNLTTLNAPNNVTLAGTGKVTMSNNGNNHIDGNSPAILTNQSTIQGGGMIGPHLTLANQGTINANLTGAALLFNQATGATNTNTATMEATNGATLQLQTGGGGSINNTGGTIKAVGTGSQVQLTGFGTTITGGTLTTSGGGLIVETAGGISTLSGLTNSGTFSILDGATVNLEGTLTNTGTIQLNAGGNLTTLNAPNNVTLAGTGKVTMSNNGNNHIDGNSPAILTNQSTIQGGGMIGPHLTLANQGTINANLTGAALLFNQATGATNTNTATMEATNGATLQLQTGGGGSINNTGGTIKAVGTGSQVQLTGFGTTITGGTLTTSGGGLIVEPAGGISTLSGLTNSGTFQMLDGSTVNFSGTLTNNGTIQVNSTGNLTTLNAPSNVSLAGTGSVVMNNNPNSTIDGNGGVTFTNQSTIQGGGTIGPHVTFNNKGTLNAVAGDTLNVNGPFLNFSGTTLRGGKYLVTGTLQFTGANIVTNAANVTLSGATPKIIDQNGANGLANFATNAASGSLTLATSKLTTTLGFRNAGTVNISAGSNFIISRGYAQTAGMTTVDGILRARGLINIQAGNVFGTNTLMGSVTSSGTITPGDSPTQTAKLAITGAYTQNSTGSLNTAIAGITPGTQYGQLNVTGAASLNGILNVSLLNGFLPNVGDTFSVLNASSVTGTFATVNGLCIDSSEHFAVTYEATDVLLTVVSGPCT